MPLSLSRFLSLFLFSARYKLLNKTLLGELTSFLRRCRFEGLGASSGRPISPHPIPSSSLFRSVLQGDVGYRVHVINIVIVVSISACVSNYPDFSRCKIQSYVCADFNKNSERSWNETNNVEFMRERMLSLYLFSAVLAKYFQKLIICLFFFCDAGYSSTLFALANSFTLYAPCNLF